ncbi:PilN domain-containing protein [Bacillus salipaludis]|uniref:PilN domain-containing protein n=1 Tax=Bacillus salipaludis TaxID=2547811 RepID=A0AA90R9T5_9BACI|nr:PilN domain-containing protein [Bacillus salipaludis]MDQ6599823.1 PilN domain-containing protein [Bacillus salipaludis]
MLVEINLLPKKEPKKINLIIALGSGPALFLLIGGFYLWQINSTKSDVADVDRQISMTQKIAEQQQQKTDSAESTNSVSQLKGAIEWANNYPIHTIPVMKHLNSLLPERGFIQSFSYTEAGTVTLTVQFDSAREAAYFLDSLNESKWIEEANLNSLSTTETNTADTTAVSNNQTNTTSTSASTNIQNTATTSTNNQTNTTSNPSNDTDQSNNSGTTNNNSSQPTKNSNDSNSKATNQTGNTTSSSSPNSSSSTLNSTNNKKVKKYLPRYTGQFEIKLNKDNIKEILNKGKKDQEGVTGS